MIFKRHFREAKKYLSESKNSIYFVCVVFIFSILAGFIASDLLVYLGINDILRGIVDKTRELNTLELTIFIFFNNSISALGGLILGIFLFIYPIISAVLNGVVLGFVLERTAAIAGIVEWWRILPHGVFELPAVMIALGVGIQLGYEILNNFLKRKKDSRFLGIIALVLGLGGMMLVQLGAGNLFTQHEEFISYVAAFTIFLFGLVLLIPFVTLFFASDKRIRKYNIQRIRKAVKVYLLIVLPLLVIAAIIEGILIGALRA